MRHQEIKRIIDCFIALSPQDQAATLIGELQHILSEPDIEPAFVQTGS